MNDPEDDNVLEGVKDIKLTFLEYQLLSWENLN
jgi:hypothetical protein